MRLDRRRFDFLDAAIAVALALLGALASFGASAAIPPIALDWQTGDVFFGADLPRVFANMTDRASRHYRSSVHPLFPLLTYPTVEIVRSVLRTDSIGAVRVVMAAIASLWTGVLFALLRRIGCRRGDAALFTVLAATSAAAVFWFAVPETYALGSVTILLVLLFTAEADRRRSSTAWLIAVNVLSLSVTVTNWMAGLLATLALRPWRQALRIAGSAFAIVIALSAFEMTLFAKIRPPFYSLSQEIALYTRPEPVATIGDASASFAIHAMVVPRIRLIDNAKERRWPMMRTQSGLRAWAGAAGAFAAASWVILLGLGAWAFIRGTGLRYVRLVLGGTLLGQLVLHLVYGDETFLYSLHWLPLLVVVAAMSTLTRARPVALILAAALILSASLNNVSQLIRTTEYFALPEAERVARLELPAGLDRR